MHVAIEGKKCSKKLAFGEGKRNRVVAERLAKGCGGAEQRVNHVRAVP
jgi:hypothetical protein